jgi:hypothetical protein
MILEADQPLVEQTSELLARGYHRHLETACQRVGALRAGRFQRIQNARGAFVFHDRTLARSLL